MQERIAEIGENAFDASTLDDARACGFDTVLLTRVDRRGLDEVRAIGDGLVPWIVLTPARDGRPLLGTGPIESIPPWMQNGEAALDPRRSPRSIRPAPVGQDDVPVEAWRDVVDEALSVGIVGFVCRDPDRLPPPFWSALIGFAGQHARSVARGVAPRWIAWTPGLARADVAALVAAGFDTTCSSLAWWDGRGHWLADEPDRSEGCANGPIRTLAFPADPFASPTDAPVADAASLTFDARLGVAAIVGDALLAAESSWRGADAVAWTGVNAWFGGQARASAGVRFVSGPGAPVTVLARASHGDLRASERVVLALLNPDGNGQARLTGAAITGALAGFGRYGEAMPAGADAAPLDPCATIELAAGEVRLVEGSRLPSIRLATPSSRRSAEAAIEKPRLAIEAIMPTVENGRFPAKRIAGNPLRVEADILIDGHEKLAARVLHRAVGDREWREARMEPIGNDRWAASFALQRVGRHEFTIEAWRDVFASYRNEIDKKFAAGLDVSLELIEGRLLVDDAFAHARTLKRPNLVRRLATLQKTLENDVAGDRQAMAAQVGALLASQTLADMQDADRRAFATRPEATFPVDAERGEAAFASWYELFPRSLGNPPGAPATHHGTFDDVIARLPAVRAMGFDVLYFPPIHPIGRRNRKGRNNSLTALADDPGSPYAIGSPDGGHDALHPDLGTFEDFQRLRDAALDNGLELALDFAIQCSPDHPWLEDHPGWFAWRPDGSLRYAENPPKKYEDIVNVEFYGHGRGGDAAPALWSALRDVILLWVGEGVRIFRVDNPHTKPLPFWEWMIGEVRAKYPDVIFLSEAFTRPKVMYRLAKVGFSQSYTYFTWRHTKQEFIDYLTELTGPESRESLHAAPRDFFRPNFFVNTPDINPVFLQRSGRAGFLIRAALAATLSGLWGVYSGFELCEATPVPGKEDYLDSEKYQLRGWDWARPGHIIREITALNRMRRDNPALQTHLNIRFQNVFDPNILYFSKATEDHANVVLVAINLDPHGVHEADFELPLWEWGLGDDAVVAATDLVDGHAFRWQGKTQRMRLDPAVNPYAIWRVTV